MGVSTVTFNVLCLTPCLCGDICVIQTPGKAMKLVYICDVASDTSDTHTPQCIHFPTYMGISVPYGLGLDHRDFVLHCFCQVQTTISFKHFYFYMDLRDTMKITYLNYAIIIRNMISILCTRIFHKTVFSC